MSDTRLGNFINLYNVVSCDPHSVWLFAYYVNNRNSLFSVSLQQKCNFDAKISFVGYFSQAVEPAVNECPLIGLIIIVVIYKFYHQTKPILFVERQENVYIWYTYR